MAPKYQIPGILDIVNDLTDTMREKSLIGLAAPQIGYRERIFVTEIRETPTRKPEETDPLRIFINPKILTFSEEYIDLWEGCGSVQNAKVFGLVSRPKDIHLQYEDIDGNIQSLSASGLLSRVIQHEYDHLEGKIFIDLAKDCISVDEYKAKFLK